MSGYFLPVKNKVKSCSANFEHLYIFEKIEDDFMCREPLKFWGMVSLLDTCTSPWVFYVGKGRLTHVLACKSFITASDVIDPTM